MHKYIICKNNTLISRSVTNDARNYHQFWKMFSLEQIIKSRTRITCRNTSLIDHILASIPSQVWQKGAINTSVSDHQLIYCSRKINKIKTACSQTQLFARLKSTIVDAYKDALKKVNFPNYKLFNDVKNAYSNFFQRLRIIVDSIAPIKTKSLKANTQKWFDGEVLEDIITKDKFNKSRLHVDKDLYTKAKYNTLKLIVAKNEHFLMIKSLWKTKRTMGNLKISRHAIENTNFKLQCSWK